MPKGDVTIIFLDVDGVLNTLGNTLVDDEKDAEHRTIPFGCPCSLDRRLLHQLKQFVDMFNALIVLSSTWRTDLDAVRGLESALEEEDIDPKRVIGQTEEFSSGRAHRLLQQRRNLPETRARDCISASTNTSTHASTYASIRACEIQHWLMCHESEYAAPSWLAIDDMDLGKNDIIDGRHFLKTNPSHGLTAERAHEGMLLLQAQLEAATPSKEAAKLAPAVLPADRALAYERPTGGACSGALEGTACYTSTGGSLYWCMHDDCLESLQTYATTQKLEAHTKATHERAPTQRRCEAHVRYNAAQARCAESAELLGQLGNRATSR
jgi:hypothetical protein